jgi:putative Mg2+ transporter-C (MgtC) family protein
MLSDQQVALRLAISAVLGAVVGIERERGDQAAGLRTHALVCMGASLFMIVGAFGFEAVNGPTVKFDPTRVAAQVASGIGFLGAGTILRRQEMVKGLTTAASLWAVAAVGLAVGGGMWLTGICGSVLIVVILAFIKPLERRFLGRGRRGNITLIVKREATVLPAIKEMVEKSSVRLERLTVQPEYASGQDRVDLITGEAQPDALLALMESLRQVPGLQEISSAGTANGSGRPS